MGKQLAKLLAAALCGALLVLGALAWVARSDRSAKAPPQTLKAADPAPQPVSQPTLRLHNYDVREGMDYGYTSLVSTDQQRAGQVGAPVVMFSYAGQRNGRHQAHLRKANILQAVECSSPCEVVKVMSVIDEDGLRQSVNVEHIRNTRNMIAGLVLEDAINGRLEPYAEFEGVRRYELWVDQAKGLTRKRVKDADAPLAKN